MQEVLCLSATEDDSLYTFTMLEDKLRKLTANAEIDPKGVQTREDLEQFLQAVDVWYKKHGLHRLGSWCKDIAIIYLIDKYLQRYPNPPGASYHTLFITRIETSENQSPKQINFIDYLYQASHFQDDVFGTYIPSFWLYDPTFEKRSDFKKKIMEHISKRVDEYVHWSERSAESGLEKIATQRKKTIESEERNSFSQDNRLHWLYLRHMEKLKIEQIARRCELLVSEQYISRTTQHLANLIGITL